jgi:ferric-dicitrate binding protein FerR (iron transport regulator)
MNDEPALRLLRELKAECPAATSTLEDAERAVRHVAFMDQVVKANRRRRLLVPSALAFAAALGLLLMSVARSGPFARAPEPKTPLARLAPALPEPGRVTPISGSLRIQDVSARERELSASAPLLRGERVSSGPKSQAVVQLASGARATLSERSSLVLEETGQDQALRLSSGRVELSVPPLGPHSLSVVTTSARVTVVGTRFSVTVEPVSAQLARTCVSVTEGRVAVAAASSNVVLGAGALWSSDGRACQAGAEQAPAASPSASAKLVEPQAPVRAGRAPERAPAEATASRSSLADQNRLFASALHAREAGDRARARALWSELLERFPDAALAPQARRELEKLERGSESQ